MAEDKGVSMGKVGKAAEKGNDVARGMAQSGGAGSGATSGQGSADAAPGMSKVGQSAGKGEDVARGMNQAATSAASSMQGASARATRDIGQAANTMASAGASAARSMGQATANAMSNMGDISKMFEGMRMPAMPDMDLMLGAYRRNMEALSAANRVALEGAQQVARRNMEIMQQTMGEMTEAMRGLTSAESPQDRASKQAEMVKGAYERAVSHMKELADLIQRSNGEALEVLNQRFTEAVDEARTMMDKARSS